MLELPSLLMFGGQLKVKALLLTQDIELMICRLLTVNKISGSEDPGSTHWFFFAPPKLTTRKRCGHFFGISIAKQATLIALPPLLSRHQPKEKWSKKCDPSESSICQIAKSNCLPLEQRRKKHLLHSILLLGCEGSSQWLVIIPISSGSIGAYTTQTTMLFSFLTIRQCHPGRAVRL